MPAKQTCWCMTCQKCRTREWARARYRQKAYGRWQSSTEAVDADMARHHIAKLRAKGASVATIAEAAGLGHSTISKIIRGKQSIAAETARRIMAADVAESNRIPTHRQARRLQALAAIGWTFESLGPIADIDPGNLARMARGAAKYANRVNFDKVCALYDELHMTPGPSEDARKRAAAKGWLPPLAWDDIDTDTEPQRHAMACSVDDCAGAVRSRGMCEPHYRKWWKSHRAEGGEMETKSEYDPIVVERIVSGDYRLPATDAERLEVIRIWQANGITNNEITRRTGWNVWRYQKRAS